MWAGKPRNVNLSRLALARLEPRYHDKMALTIDDEMNVDMDNMDNMDDLFGDGSNCLLPEDHPPPKELYQRIEELRSSGCHQSVFSKTSLSP